MNITRHGSAHNHGTTEMVTEFPLKNNGPHSDTNVLWRFGELWILVKNVPDPGGRGTHDYKISLTIADICTIIGAMSDEVAPSNVESMNEHLSQHVPAIVKLLSCAVKERGQLTGV